MADRDHLRAVLLAAQEMPPGQVDELVDSLADVLPTEPPRRPSILSSLRAVIQRHTWGDVYGVAALVLGVYVGLFAAGLGFWVQGDPTDRAWGVGFWIFWSVLVLAAIIATYGTLGRE